MNVSRHQFLGGLVAAGAGASLVSAPAWPQTAARIDVHHHYAPAEWITVVDKENPSVATFWKKWSQQAALEEMDRGGVQKAILSITTPGISFGDAQSARRLARICNDNAAKMIADHPGRFGMFVGLPLPDVEGSLAEIAYGLDTLKADGVGLFTSYGSKWLGDPAFNPIYEELNRRKALVFVHPTTPVCCARLVPGITDADIEYGTDTTRAIARMVFTGTTRRYPDMRIIWSHAGGTMPHLEFRFIREAEERYKSTVPNGFLGEVRRFYYDTAQTADPAPMAALSKIVPVSHILFGSDYPYLTITENVNGLKSCGIFSTRDLAAIDRTNSLALLRA